jgi:F0F1-type ATP synthase membrane subunit b/b'
MIWVLNRTFFSPINRVLQSRDRNRGGHSSEAQKILEQVNQKNQSYEEEIRKARLEGYQLVEAERAEALARRQVEVETVKTEVSQTVEREKSAIQRETEEARVAIAADAHKMAERISSTILKA